MCRDYKLIVSTCAVSCYLASIWFAVADEKIFIVSALSNMGHEVGCIASQKLSCLQVLCAGALFCLNVKLFSQACEHDYFGRFLWLQW